MLLPYLYKIINILFNLINYVPKNNLIILIYYITIIISIIIFYFVTHIEVFV